MSYVLESNIRVKSYDHSNFTRTSVVQFRASRWVMSPNRTFVWKVLTNQICRELPLFNFERLNILIRRIEHPSEMLWSFEFLESFRCSIPSVSICYGTVSDIREKRYCRLNWLRASTFNFERLNILRDSIRHPSKKLLLFELAQRFNIKFRASRYVTGLYQTSVKKVIVI